MLSSKLKPSYFFLLLFQERSFTSSAFVFTLHPVHFSYVAHRSVLLLTYCSFSFSSIKCVFLMPLDQNIFKHTAFLPPFLLLLLYDSSFRDLMNVLKLLVDSLYLKHICHFYFPTSPLKSQTFVAFRLSWALFRTASEILATVEVTTCGCTNHV